MPDPAQILQEAYDQVRRDYGAAVGRRREELVTPALVLDIGAAQRNIDHMASELKQLGAAAKASLQLTYLHFGQDQGDVANLYQSGDRLQAVA